MDRFKALSVFVQVVDRGSFSRAAEQMGLPRSTVSAVISQLERDLSVRLLHRTTRQVTPTAAGISLLERARQLLLEMEQIETLFHHEGRQVRGRLKINVPSRIASRLIAPALPAFLERYPELDLVIGATDRAIDLIQEGVDCVIRVGTNESSSLIARTLGSVTMINCASPAYLEKFGMPETLLDLEQHWAVSYSATMLDEPVQWEYNLAGERQFVTMKSRVTVNQADNYIACAVAGLGLIQVPAYDVQEHLQKGALQEVLPQWQANPMPVTALYPHRQYLSPRVKVFVEWMDSLLKSID